MTETTTNKSLLHSPFWLPLRRIEGLPANFKFGAATSAYQVEGAVAEDGRGASIWDPFLADPAKPHSGDTGEIACDHYHRFREDVALMAALGLDAYRFSIAWPRIFPDGRGAVNEKGLDFYSRLVDELLRHGIEPFATLYHWDLPLALQKDFGGWLSRRTLSHFAEYSEVVVKRLGDRVKNWSTFNEPEVIIAGYVGPGMAPGLNRPDVAFHVGHNLLVAHGLAAQAIRAARSDAKVGIVLNFNIIDPADRSEEAIKAARNAYVRAYSWYLDALTEGTYPECVMKGLATVPRVPGVNPRPRGKSWIKHGDMKLIKQALDFLGINYYTRFVVDGAGRHVEIPGIERSQMGWQLYPFGLARLMDDLHRNYKLPPVYITENGLSVDDRVEREKVKDRKRAKFIIDHLDALGTAVATTGVDVRGYFVWSLMDNLEWPLGFAKTFGIVHIDRKNNLKRTVKESGWHYARTIRLHRARRPGV